MMRTFLAFVGALALLPILWFGAIAILDFGFGYEVRTAAIAGSIAGVAVWSIIVFEATSS